MSLVPERESTHARYAPPAPSETMAGVVWSFAAVQTIAPPPGVVAAAGTECSSIRGIKALSRRSGTPFNRRGMGRPPRWMNAIAGMVARHRGHLAPSLDHKPTIDSRAGARQFNF